MTRYIKVDWPESQDYIEHSRFNECYNALILDKSDNYANTLFVPEDLYEEIQIDKLYPVEANISLGHLKIKSNYIELNGIKYTRNIHSLKKGSEVILYSDDKGYWITKCIAYSDRFPPIFEDSSTLIDSEIIGIRNNG